MSAKATRKRLLLKEEFTLFSLLHGRGAFRKPGFLFLWMWRLIRY